MVTTDFHRFVETLRSRTMFEPGAPVAISRAPGRLDVMGGIADYSGSLVLQRPIAEATFAAVQPIDRAAIEVISLGRPPFSIPLQTLAPDGAPVGYDEARRMLASERWTSYVVGMLLVLAREGRFALTSGMRIVIASNVPEGKGVSSSAAIETATMSAVARAFDIAIEPRDLALLCQKGENLVAGAPCGVMDQMTCVFGEEQALMALLCQPAELQPSVAVPDDIELWGIDSGERHSIGGSDYGAVRAGAFMGLRILSESVQVPGNYLANIEPSTFERELRGHLPEEMSGDEFLSRYGRTTDSVTTAERGCTYRVRAPTAHPVYERERAEAFRRLLRERADEPRRAQLGELMYGSHASYGACGLGSRGTDLLVDLVRAEGAVAGLYGARITGGGSGGTVAVIGRRDAAPAMGRVVDAYERATGYRPYVFAGSSPGVFAFGKRSIAL